MVKKSIAFLVIALITLSITNLESKQPKSKYVAVLAWQNDSIIQNLYIRKMNLKYLNFKFETINISTNKVLFSMEGIGKNEILVNGLQRCYDECAGYDDFDFAANQYIFTFINSSKLKCPYMIAVSIALDRARVFSYYDRACVYNPPGSNDICLGTLRRVK